MPDNQLMSVNLTLIRMERANHYTVKSYSYTGGNDKPKGYRRQHERAARRSWNKATKELANDLVVNGDSAVVLTDYTAPYIH